MGWGGIAAKMSCFLHMCTKKGSSSYAYLSSEFSDHMNQSWLFVSMILSSQHTRPAKKERSQMRMPRSTPAPSGHGLLSIIQSRWSARQTKWWALTAPRSGSRCLAYCRPGKEQAGYRSSKSRLLDHFQAFNFKQSFHGGCAGSLMETGWGLAN